MLHIVDGAVYAVILLLSRKALFYSDIAQRWCFPFPGPDKAVVRVDETCLLTQCVCHNYYCVGRL